MKKLALFRLYHKNTNKGILMPPRIMFKKNNEILFINYPHEGETMY